MPRCERGALPHVNIKCTVEATVDDFKHSNAPNLDQINRSEPIPFAPAFLS